MLPTPNGSGPSQEFGGHWPETPERSPCVAGVVPVIYYSVLLGLGLPGEWGAGPGLWGWPGTGVLLRREPVFVLTPETQGHRPHRPPGSPCLYGDDLGPWGTKQRGSVSEGPDLGVRKLPPRFQQSREAPTSTPSSGRCPGGTEFTQDCPPPGPELPASPTAFGRQSWGWDWGGDAGTDRWSRPRGITLPCLSPGKPVCQAEAGPGEVSGRQDSVDGQGRADLVSLPTR